MDYNACVANANSGDLAFFLQEKGLCEEFVRWCEEMPPVERLLKKSKAAREVHALLKEGKKRGYEPAVVTSALHALSAEQSPERRDDASAKKSG